MTCAEYDDLYAHAQGRCQICGIKEAFAPQGKLFIDHDHRIGAGLAVRGLLCGRCNTGIDRRLRPMTGPDVDQYLATPWHSRPTPSLYLPDPIDGMSVEERLTHVGDRLLRIRREGRISCVPAREFVRWHVKPAIRAARRAGISAPEIARRTGYSTEYVRLIWKPIRGDPGTVAA